MAAFARYCGAANCAAWPRKRCCALAAAAVINAGLGPDGRRVRKKPVWRLFRKGNRKKIVRLSTSANIQLSSRQTRLEILVCDRCAVAASDAKDQREGRAAYTTSAGLAWIR